MVIFFKKWKQLFEAIYEIDNNNNNNNKQMAVFQDGEMVHQLRALTALWEDSGSIPSTYVAAYSHL